MFSGRKHEKNLQAFLKFARIYINIYTMIINLHTSIKNMASENPKLIEIDG